MDVTPKPKPILKSSEVRHALSGATVSRPQTLQHQSLSRLADDIGSQDTRQVIHQLSKVQLSLSDLVAEHRSKKPESYKSAVSELLTETLITGNGTNQWSSCPVESIEKAFATNLERGLTTAQVRINRELYGSNKVATAKGTPWWRFLIGTFKSPISILLAVGFILTLCFKEWTSSIAIGILVLASSISSTLMEMSAAKALEALAQLSSPHCDAIRDGVRMEIESDELVVGDLVVLSSGDSLPADLRFVEVSDLKVNEALLTGESKDISKTAESIEGNPGPFPQNLGFSSTTVVSGNGKGIVYAVGLNTQVGLIAEKLAEETNKGVKKTPLEVALDRLGGLIGIFVIIILIIILVVAWLTHYTDPSRPEQNRIVTIIILAVGFAVAAIPASLPAVVTSCFAMGCKLLKAQQAQIRRLPAVETLGCTSVICTDKTGTLTQAAMTVLHLDMLRRVNAADCEIVPTTFYPTERYKPNGGLYLNSCMPAVLSKDSNRVEALNLGNIKNESPDSKYARFALLVARLAAPTTDLQLSDDGVWSIAGNSTDGAIVVASAKAGWSSVTKAEGHVDPRELWELDDEHSIPFSSSRKLEMCVYHIREERHRYFGDSLVFDPDVVGFICFKGAPEIILDFCDYVASQDQKSGTILLNANKEFDDKYYEELKAANEAYSKQALRVIAIGIIPMSQSLMNQIRSVKDKNLEVKILTSQKAFLVSLMACLDPPKKGVAEAIKTCHTAGIRVVVITGDQVMTAEAIARMVGLDAAADIGAITCDRLTACQHGEEDPEAINESIDQITMKYSIFCRARPEDKLTIVQSLQRQGHVVAMTGDGVNDAPALQTADIGVAMGITGTDVAKGAADLVLMDDNFATIVTAVREGRRIFINVQHFVAFLIGTVFGETVYMTISILAGLKIPIDAIHVLFIGLICDALPAIGIGKEPSEPNTMRVGPRPRNTPILSKCMWIYGILPLSFFVTAVVLGATTLAMYLSSGVFTARQLERLCLVNDSGSRYYCQAAEYVVASGFNSQFVTNVDFVQDGRIVQYLGAILGNYGTNILTPEELGIDRTRLNCPPGAEDPTYGWCTQLSESSSSHVDVTVRASRMVASMSFTTAALCEVLWPYVIRSWLPMWKVFNRSGWFHVALSIPTVLTLMASIVPGWRTAMGLMPIPPWRHMINLAFIGAFLLAPELTSKPLYRWRHMKNIGMQKPEGRSNVAKGISNLSTTHHPSSQITA